MEHYDEAYFDRWYRDPETCVSSAEGTLRKASMALSVAEYYLERPVRTVLDVGCGEGNWLHSLQALRPAITYVGIDSSSYAVSRYGETRNIRLGSFATMEEIGLADNTYDLIICSDTLAYVSSEELDTGLASLSKRANGIAFLELYTKSDPMGGDNPVEARPAAFYRSLLQRHGFVSVGSHCYLGPTLVHQAMEMERQ